MAYSTLADIEKLIPEDAIVQLTDDAGIDAVDEEKVVGAIAQADSEIDAYCGGKYTVPFATAPDIIKKMSVDMAIYHLYSRRLEGIPETRSDRYKNCVRILEQISKGNISIGEDPEPAAPTDSGPATTKTTDDRIFSDGKLGNY